MLGLLVSYFCLSEMGGKTWADLLTVVVVLGLNDTNAARRLVRLLLSDPLAPKGDWEELLDGYDADTSRGLLIRYGLHHHENGLFSC